MTDSPLRLVESASSQPVTLVDSCVLVDIATDDPHWAQWSAGAVARRSTLAGKALLAYRRRGGQKRSPLPDFYIGAHAAVRSYRLLTRDATRYRTYFPG